MFSSDFSEILDSFPNVKERFKGTYASDTFPKHFKTNQFAIINTDKSTEVGVHWYCAFKSSKVKLEIFDSLGVDSSKKSFLLNSVKVQGIKLLEFNSTKFQSDDSNSCGKFVLYFIVNRLYNLDHSFKDILNEIFVPKQEENEEKVQKYYQEILSTS